MKKSCYLAVLAMFSAYGMQNEEFNCLLKEEKYVQQLAILENIENIAPQDIVIKNIPLSTFLGMNDPLVNNAVKNLCSCLNTYKKRNEGGDIETKKTILEFDVMMAVKHISDRLGQICIDENNNYKEQMLKIMQELICFCDECEKTASVLLDIVKRTPDFLYCWGIVGYYCADRKGMDEKEFKQLSEKFFKYTGANLSKENALELIRQSNCENAYWFLEGIEANEN